MGSWGISLHIASVSINDHLREWGSHKFEKSGKDLNKEQWSKMIREKMWRFIERY